MRDRQGNGVFNARSEQHRKGLYVHPAMWRTLRESATRRACSVRDRISGVTKHNPEVALRLYIAQLYRMGVAQLKKSDLKRRP